MSQLEPGQRSNPKGRPKGTKLTDRLSTEFPGSPYVHVGTGVSISASDDVTGSDASGIEPRMAMDVYSNVTYYQASMAITPEGTDHVFGDRISTTGFGVLDESLVSVYNSSSSPGPLLTATLRVSFYDASDWPTYPNGYPTTLFGWYEQVWDFGTGLAPGEGALISATGLAGFGIALTSTTLLVTHQVVSHTGNVTGLGVGLYHPPTTGNSDAEYWFVDTPDYPAGMYYQSFPLGNIPLRIAVLPTVPPGEDVLHDQSDFVVDGPRFADVIGLFDAYYGYSDITVDGDGWNIERIVSYYSLDIPDWGSGVFEGRINIFPKTGSLPLWPGHSPYGAPLVPMSASHAGDHWVVTAWGLDIDLAPGEYWIGMTPSNGYLASEGHLSSGTYVGNATATLFPETFFDPPYWANQHPGVDAALLIKGTRLCSGPVIDVDETPIDIPSIPLNGFHVLNTFLVGNDGCAPLDFVISGDCPGVEASGTVPPGGVAAPVMILFPFGYAPGSYSCWMTVSSNDPDTPVVNVPINFTVTGTVSDATPGVCYATQGPGGFSDWIAIDPTTGEGTPTGTTIFPVVGLTIADDGRIWAPYDNKLYYLDATTGAMIQYAVVGCWEEIAAFEGNLYGIDCADQLWELDLGTGVQSGPFTVVSPSVDGLDIDPTTGVLWVSEAHSGPGTDNLYVINLFSGDLEPLLVGSLGLGLPIGGIAFDDDGNLFAVVGDGSSPSEFVSIDKGTGAATVIGETGSTHLAGLAMIGSGLLSAPNDEAPIPTTVSFRVASPNPFRSGTSLSFELPEARPVRLVIFDTTGRQVRTLVDGTYPAAAHRAVWDGRDLSGRTVAPGVYFARIRAGEYESVQRLTLIR